MSGLRVVAIFNAFIISSAFIACQRVQITICNVTSFEKALHTAKHKPVCDLDDLLHSLLFAFFYQLVECFGKEKIVQFCCIVDGITETKLTERNNADSHIKAAVLKTVLLKFLNCNIRIGIL